MDEIGNYINTTRRCVWIDDTPTMEDMKHIMDQANDEFDEYNLKAEVMNDLREKRATLICKTSNYAKILAIVYADTNIPWDMFGKIFKACGKPPMGEWRVVWFASKKKRMLPEIGKEPSRGHINGGYTQPCSESTIVIYREEEACRVLIHELLHAACTDVDTDIIDIEINTEAWAELILIAILAAGNKQLAESLWNIQAQWIVNQEYRLMRKNNVNSRKSYAWRYTIGRRALFTSLGLRLPNISKKNQMSLRLTSPRLFM